MNKPRLLITVEGGLITGLDSDQEIDIVIVDYDIEDAEDEDTKVTPIGGIAYIRHDASVVRDPSELDEWFAGYRWADQ